MSTREPLSGEELARRMKETEPYRMGLDLVPDHVMITDTNGNIVYANPASQRATGYTLEEMIGRNPGDLWGGGMPREFYERMWNTIKVEKKPFVGEVHNKKKDGSSEWQEIHISPILGGDGEPRFFLSIEPDITEKKQKERFRDEFASVLGAQLVDPLTSIQWLAKFLLKTDELTEAQRGKLSSIYDINESLLTLVTDLVAMSRTGGEDVPVETFDLAAEIEVITIDAKKSRPSVSITFRKPDDTKFPLTADKSLALQVFRNLVMNAVQYCDKDHGVVGVKLEKQDGEYVFSVENNGLSILLEDKPKLFSKAFRTEGAKEVRKEGSGLGLFIVRLIAERFRWRVWFESPAPSQSTGAVFFVKIPATG